jgi:hypothetical protein
MSNRTSETELDEIRFRLEQVAMDHNEKRGGTWEWDSSKMHLTLFNPDRSPMATLHVEHMQ